MQLDLLVLADDLTGALEAGAKLGSSVGFRLPSKIIDTATRHVPADADRIQTIIRLTVEALRRLKTNPRIAVAGLNPHAGENGLFGDEEIREIRPAIEWAQAQGMPVEGPFPPDTLFYVAVKKNKFDAIPIIRTSVDHGTAFDIAGQGIASTRSLDRALEFAVRISGAKL